MTPQTFVRIRIVVAIATLLIVLGCASISALVQRDPIRWDEAKILSGPEIRQMFSGNMLISA